MEVEKNATDVIRSGISLVTALTLLAKGTMRLVVTETVARRRNGRYLFFLYGPIFWLISAELVTHVVAWAICPVIASKVGNPGKVH